MIIHCIIIYSSLFCAFEDVVEQASSYFIDGSVNPIKLFLELSEHFQNSYSGIPLFRFLLLYLKIFIL